MDTPNNGHEPVLFLHKSRKAVFLPNLLPNPMLEKLNRHDSTKAIIHSLAFFMIAYLIIWVFQGLATVLIASGLEIPTVWYFDRIDFIIPQALWDADKVKLTFSGAPLISLILAMLCLVAYYKVMEFNGILKMLFLWGYIHGWTGFFGAIFIGTLTSTGFGYVVVWLYLTDTFLLLVSLISLFMLFIGGMFIARPALISANYYLNLLPEDSRSQFILMQFLIPGIIGLVLLTLIRMPATFENQLIPATLFLVLLPVYMRRLHFPDLYFDDEPIRTRIEWVYPVVAVILIAAFRLVFALGIRSGF